MSMQFEWLSRLNRDNKGVWGIVTQLESTRGAKCVSDSSRSKDCEMEEVYVVNEYGRILFRCTNSGTVESNLEMIVKNTLMTALELQRTFVRIVFFDFHTISNVERCSIIKTARGIQESITTLSCQFIFCGVWSYFSFRDSYFSIHGGTTSPAAEFKNILYVPSKKSKEVLDELCKQGFIRSQPTELDIIACDFLIEQTSGDEFLLEKALEYLKERNGQWIENIESVLGELILAPEIVARIQRRVEWLDSDSKNELKKLLRSHRLVRPADSIVSENLWIAGLIQRHESEGGKQLIQISGPIINTVIRNISTIVGLGAVAPSGALCLDGCVISAAAYPKVAEMENILRSMIVSEWFENLGLNWHENLAKVSTIAHEKNEDEDIVKTVIRCMKDAFPELQGREKAAAECLEPVRKKKKHENILESSRDWQRRQNEHHAVVLAKNNLMHFLTTEALRSVITAKAVGLLGESRVFENKEFLITTLDEFISIRSAVAHNQPIMLGTLFRLNALHRKISDWATVFVDQNIKSAEAEG